MSKGIVLNGPSSAGKSSVAGAMKEMLGEKLCVVAPDDFLQVEPMQSIYEDDVFDAQSGMNRAIMEALNQGKNVVFDHVMTGARILDSLKCAVGSHALTLVHIFCLIGVLRQRELARGDRVIGNAEITAKYLYPKENYDAEFDSSKLSPREIAKKLVDFL